MVYTHKSWHVLHHINLYYQVLTGYSNTLGLGFYDYSQTGRDFNLHSSSLLRFIMWNRSFSFNLMVNVQENYEINVFIYKIMSNQEIVIWKLCTIRFSMQCLVTQYLLIQS